MNTAADRIINSITERNIVNVAEGGRNTEMADTILRTVNRVENFTKKFSINIDQPRAFTIVDSKGEVLPLYTVTCIE